MLLFACWFLPEIDHEIHFSTPSLWNVAVAFTVAIQQSIRPTACFFVRPVAEVVSS